MKEPCFVTDIYLPQMSYALTIRSPVAKGTLKSVDCPKLPSAYTLITAKDIPGKNFLEDTSLPVLAGEELSYIGEPVALLLGPDKNVLEDYSRHCKVVAEEEAPVFSPNEADAGSIDASRIVAKRDILIGDPETAFTQAASVVRESYSTGIQEHWYAEPSGAVAWLDETNPKPNGSANTAVVVAAASQWPFHVRRSVAHVLGLAAARVLVQPGLTGIHLDGKLWYPSLIACHAALGAWIAQRPVRLVLTRREDFSFSPKRCGTKISVAHALNDKEEITGIEINTTVNLGAHAVNATEILDHVNLGNLMVYKTKNIRLSGAAIRTNIPPQGPFAGFGLAQGFFAMERQASRIADTLKQDPAQWRFDNSVKTPKDPASLQQLITMVVGMSDYRRKWAAYELLRQSRGIHLAQEPMSGSWNERNENLRGIGIALGCQGSGFLYHGADKGAYGIELILEKDGTLEIKTSMAGSCGDYEHIWAGIASEILGIGREMIRINGSTDSPDSGPQTMSRNVTVLTKLVGQACLAIGKKRSRDPLPISVRKTVRPQKDPVWPAWNEYFPQASDYSGFARPGWASAIVEVEIDPIDYLPMIRGVWLSVDGGKIISPDRARKSLKDSAVQALGWAYREQINYVNGAIPPEQFDNFDIPGPAEIPPIAIDFIENRHDEPRGIGDLPFACIPAAYVQAVSQAADYCFRSIPLTARDIWEGITS
jgi:CO/xanthine dehydrogenase Mo-binding subunit